MNALSTEGLENQTQQTGQHVRNMNDHNQQCK